MRRTRAGRRARKQLLAESVARKRARLADERPDDVPVVDLVVAVAADARHRGRRLGAVAVVDLDELGILSDLHLAGDETRGDRVDAASEVDRAPLPHRRGVRRVLGQPRVRERQQVLSLLRKQRRGLAVVDPAADFLDERHVRLHRREVAAPSQDELLAQRRLEDVVGLLGDAVLVRLPRLDPCGGGTVVAQHVGEAAVELASAAGELVRRGGEVVATPDTRHPAELPRARSADRERGPRTSPRTPARPSATC